MIYSFLSLYLKSKLVTSYRKRQTSARQASAVNVVFVVENLFFSFLTILTMVFLVRTVGLGAGAGCATICVDQDAKDAKQLAHIVQQRMVSPQCPPRPSRICPLTPYIHALFQGLPEDSVRLELRGRPVAPGDALPSGGEVALTALPLCGGLPGGKGGFGSMLRALGAQIEKTTNREACRDLSGRRLRDINEEERLKKYVAKKAQREQEQEEKRRDRMTRLQRLANGENKHEFHDPDYIRQREEATDRVHDAMESLKKREKDGKEAAGSSSSAAASSSSDPQPSTSGLKRKAEPEKEGPEQKKKAASKAKDVWVGVELSESDLESSSDEDEDSGESKTESA